MYMSTNKMIATNVILQENLDKYNELKQKGFRLEF